MSKAADDVRDPAYARDDVRDPAYARPFMQAIAVTVPGQTKGRLADRRVPDDHDAPLLLVIIQQM